MTTLSDIIKANFSTIKLLDHPFDNCVKFDNKGKIVEEHKFKINDAVLNIQNSKFIGNPEDRFETLFFLPNNDKRKGEGGLRTKGFFKHSYKYVKNNCKDNAQSECKIETGGWYIIDSNDKPLKLAPGEIQQNINDYISTMKHNQDNSIKTATPENIVYLPLISVITVVYNGAKYLEETILSILNQSYPNIEYIIIDGGSTDDTLDIIKKYENYIDYWISEPDNGIYDAMNKGIKLTTGIWINFMNASDQFENNKLITNIFGKGIIYKEFDIIFGSTKRLYDKGYFISVPSFFCNPNKGMGFSHQSAFIRSNLHKKIPFSNKLKIMGDFDFFCNCLINNIQYLQVPHTISTFKTGGASRKEWKTNIKERIYIFKKYLNSRKVINYIIFFKTVFNFIFVTLFIGENNLKKIKSIFNNANYVYFGNNNKK